MPMVCGYMVANRRTRANTSNLADNMLILRANDCRANGFVCPSRQSIISCLPAWTLLSTEANSMKTS